MAVTFRRRITWPDNDSLLGADAFNIKVPGGLGKSDVREPNFVDMTEMMRLDSKQGYSISGRGLTLTEGMVKPNLTVSFSNPAAQWRCSPVAGTRDQSHGPCQFQFTGGDVIIDLTLAIYILNTAKYDLKDHISVRIFATVYEHELLHVLDNLDIMNNWLPPRLNTEPTIAKYLVQAQPYTYGTAKMLVAQLQKEFQEFISDRIQVAIFNLWATESNRRQAQRDSPAQYKIVQDAVEELRVKQINPSLR